MLPLAGFWRTPCLCGMAAGVPRGPKVAAAGNIAAALELRVPPASAVEYVSIMDTSERARSLASRRTLPVASVLVWHARRVRILLCRMTESAEVLPLAIALRSEHVSMRSDAPEPEAIHGRASGKIPCTMPCTGRSRCDRSSVCCTAAAAVDLAPSPQIVPSHLCSKRTTSMDARNRNGQSNRT